MKKKSLLAYTLALVIYIVAAWYLHTPTEQLKWYHWVFGTPCTGIVMYSVFSTLYDSIVKP